MPARGSNPGPLVYETNSYAIQSATGACMVLLDISDTILTGAQSVPWLVPLIFRGLEAST